MKISFKKDIFFAEEFHFKSFAIDDTNASTEEVQIQVDVQIIQNESVIEIRQRSDQPIYGVFLKIPIRIKSDFYEIFVTYQAVFLTNEFKFIDNTKDEQEIASQLNVAIKQYLKLANIEILKFLNKSTRHLTPEDTNFFKKIINAIKIAQV